MPSNIARIGKMCFRHHSRLRALAQFLKLRAKLQDLAHGPGALLQQFAYSSTAGVRFETVQHVGRYEIAFSCFPSVDRADLQVSWRPSSGLIRQGI
jgi:hypothetical protein